MRSGGAARSGASMTIRYSAAMFSADRAIERLPELVNADAALVRRGRFLTTTFLVEVGETPWLVSVVEGRIAHVERGPFLLREFAFAIRAPLDAWARFWQPIPEPGWHDLFALVKRGAARIDGALHLLMQHLQYVKDVV